MRTRFLNDDLFTSCFSPDGTLSFLILPIPHLPPPRLPDFDQRIFRFDTVPNVSLEIGRLPIDSARSKFLSEVLPQKIDIDDRYFLDHPSQNPDAYTREQRRSSCGSNEIRFSEKAAKALYENEKDGTQKAYGSDYLEEHRETGTNDKQTHMFEVIQFEAPELDEFLGNHSLPEVGMKILYEVPEIDNDPDSFKPELKMQYFDEVQESVYAVDNITVEYDMDNKACLLQEDDTCHKEINFHHQSSFPLLEVDEMSLRNVSNICMEDELLLSFKDINDKDNALIDEVELLGFVQYDVLKFLGDHCLLKQHLDYDPSAVDEVLGMDVISLVDRKDSEYGSLPLSPHVFDEFEFLELDFLEIYDSFFALQKPDEPETCDWMFSDNKNFKNFNELIVSCELALEDETFKSMPIPILSDNIKSSYDVVEEMLAKIKPEPLSASDGIYLEWHLLEEDTCNSKVFSFYKSALEDFDPLNIDFDWKSFDKGKGFLDVISSDDAFNGPNVEECKESMDVFARETSSGQFYRAAPSKLSDEKCQSSGNGEQLTKATTVEPSLLFKSMSQFNDLEFFLNPGKARNGGTCEYEAEVASANTTVPKEGGPHSISAVDRDTDDLKLKEEFNFLPTEDEHNLSTLEAAQVGTCGASVPVASVPFEVKSQQIQDGQNSSFPKIMIVVNIQNLDKEMIVSRRSTYQKILALEKEGLQIVERDLDLPVDIVIAPTICVVWYDCRNIRKKVTGFDEASSCLPLCMENIATDVLTLLSFSFSCCILTFEGDTNFLSTVMECSDGLYAAAASLKIDLQLFCSYSSVLTDEIILNSISYAAKLCSFKYPKMSESETLAESFLTKFPSINPLTAHAILSSGCKLIEFLEWSKERRILEVQRCHVPEESISLFSVGCSYGEREDSKSIMTDCSSSVSSGPDSNKGHCNVAAEIKPKKYISGPEEVEIHLNSKWNSGPLNQFSVNLQSPRPIRRDDCWKSGDAEILDEFASPLEDLFAQKQQRDIPLMVDSSTLSNPRNFRELKDAPVLDEIKRPRLYLNDELLEQNEISVLSTKKKMDFNKNSKSDNLHQEFIGEVIDLTGCVDKDIPQATDSTYISTWLPQTEEYSTRKSKAARRLSFGQNCRPTFPTSEEINFGPDLWSSATGLLKNNNGYSNSDMPPKHSKKIFDDLRLGSGGNLQEAPFKVEIPHCGATPLSKAIQSTYSQPGSPWTIEFLNKIREKSRLRQQSLPSDSPNTDFVYSGDTSKATKRRSPSILEFFTYKGGSNPGKMQEQKKQRQRKQLSILSKHKSTSASVLPTWTPADKRSRQTLSYAMNDSGGQTRLVWSDGSAHHPSKKLRDH